MGYSISQLVEVIVPSNCPLFLLGVDVFLDGLKASPISHGAPRPRDVAGTVFSWGLYHQTLLPMF